MSKRKGKQISHKYRCNRARKALRLWVATITERPITFWIGERIYAEGPLEGRGGG